MSNKSPTSLACMHSFQLGDHVGFPTGQTFGGETRKANFEILARAHHHQAQHIYNHPNILGQAEKYLPPVELANPPTQAIVKRFTQATNESKNPGRTNPDSTIQSPGFYHHVDNNMYCTIQLDMICTPLSASILALSTITIGFPNNLTPDPLSRKWSSHRMRPLQTNPRKTSNSIPGLSWLAYQPKNGILQQSLARHWLTSKSFILPEAAKLIGMLDNISTMSRWSKTMYFPILNTFQEALRQ